MNLIADDSAVMEKTKELCAAITEEPEFKELLGKVERFLDDEPARTQFESVHERGEMLQQKQNVGLDLSDVEVKEFEAARAALLENPIAKEFLDAQQHLQTVQMAIGKYVGMTLELGRVPKEEDFQSEESGCCNEGGCGCSH
ncbi:MAG: YlbF family regulator [Akkermansiaceae bacterium]|nr:YlbF family regulator [Akkermansiaceae bacterium]NNM31363.1 YlbF family regulator [Akkermansiaceae bacterium]